MHGDLEKGNQPDAGQAAEEKNDMNIIKKTYKLIMWVEGGNDVSDTPRLWTMELSKAELREVFKRIDSIAYVFGERPRKKTT